MAQNNDDIKKLNIHQKLLKIQNMAGVLQKNKQGYNYKYVTEDEIQAKITAGMQKYNVMLEVGVVPGTLNIKPYTYKKFDKKANSIIDVYEVIASCEVEYVWVNADNPEDKIKKYWAYIGQMEDASQAFGGGATYGNRYYLLKALQLATTEDDPDNYRSKQKEAENYEEIEREKEYKRRLSSHIKEIVEISKELTTKGFDREQLKEIIAEINDGSANPNSIKDIETAISILNKLNKLKEGK